MKLHLSQHPGQNLFTHYGDGYVMVNQQRFERSLIVLPDKLIDDWEPRALDELTETHFAFLAGLNAEIVLLGTGAMLRFPHPRLTAPLAAQRIGFEVMDTYAVARTYNILMGEGRHVAAALLL
ncbi:MAG: Mth938-like domain-containing protein [Burkholderiales bacterium]|nr:Mth938-like domain-containing protein [Burkholderiales bacterium]